MKSSNDGSITIPSSSSSTILKDLDVKSNSYEYWINTFLAEMREGKSTRSGSGGSTKDSTSSQMDEMSRKKKAINDLYQHLQQEMPEMNDEQKKHFFDITTTKIFDLMIGPAATNPIDIKSGIMMMCILLDAPQANKHKPAICPSFANHLRNVNINVNDLELLDLMACAIGKIALYYGPSTQNFVEFEIPRAIETINNERNDITKRHSAILNLREIANVTPSYFFSNVVLIFDSIFIAINEPKLREPAISALRSALNVIIDRERLGSLSNQVHISSESSNSSGIPIGFRSSRIDQQIPLCFEICYKKVIELIDDRKINYSINSTTSKNQIKDRDDKIHASLLILNELIRCSHDSSNILHDSFSRELDFLYINMQDFNDISTFYMANYMFSHFNYSSNCGSCVQQTSSNLASTISNSVPTAATMSSVLATFKSNNYLTKILRNYSQMDTQSSMPLFHDRELHSLVSYHKDSGVAPMVTNYRNKINKPLMGSSSSCQQLIIENFDKISSLLINQLHQKNSIQINQVLLLIMPNLISLNSERFCEHPTHVNDTINYLLACVKNPSLKSLAFISLGLFSLAIKNNGKCLSNGNCNVFDQKLPLIIQQIRASFPFVRDGQAHHHHQSSKKRAAMMPDPSVFTCLAFLAQAVGPNIENDIREMLPGMFQLGLTEPLTNSLYDICKNIPSLTNDCHEGLLRMLSQIIMDKKLTFPETLSDNPSISQVSYPPNEVFDLSTVRLALKVLGRFNFEPQYLIHFVRHCADHYLSHENREIRLEAVYTCCRLLKPFLAPKNSVEKITKNVLTKLIMVGITDMDKNVRYSVLSQLDEQFYYFLSQSDNLEMLQICLNDEVFEIRELGICIMGRLCSLNPAYVMPFLRQILLQLLTELQISGISKNMEQSARMLGHLLAATPRLIRPYTEPILKVFIPKLSNPSQAVSTAVMSAIGEQAMVSGLEMRSSFYELLPILLDAIQDTTSFQKREIALWTMGRLIENCGFVIEPYWKCPTLLPILFSILKSESTKQSQLIRRETIRVLGLLGAVDPYKHKIHLGVIDLSGESLISFDPNEEQEINIHELLSNLSNNFDDYYWAQAISTLVKVMKDPNASAQHTITVTAVAFIFNVLKTRSVPYIPQILPPFIQIIRSGESRTKAFLLQQLGQIIQIVKKHIRVYLDEIFKVLRELWNTSEQMQLTLFTVVESIVIALGGEFSNYVPHLIPHIMKVLTNNDNGSKDVIMKLFGALQNFGTNLEGYIHLLIPPIVKQFEYPTKNNPEVRLAALKTIEVLSDDLKLTEFSSRIIHGIVRTVDANVHDKTMVNVAVDTLIKLAYQLGSRYQIYIPLVGKIMAKHKLHFANYDQLIKNIVDGVNIDELDVAKLLANSSKRKEINRRFRENREQQSPTTDAKRITITLDEILKQWTSKKISKEDWLEWLRKFNVDLIKESPALALRSLFPIATALNSVARELFNPAFLTCWNEISPEQQKNVIDILQIVLKEQEIPEVTGTLLNLAEYLEHIDQGPLMFDVGILGERAMKCRAYAKALHYKEKEFTNGANTEVLGALITINNKLQQSQAAYGVLRHALKSRKLNDIELKEKWFEKLNNWESAFIAHRLKYDQNNSDFEAILGQMRCLEVLSEWDNLYKLSNETFSCMSYNNKQRMARMAVNATWNLNKWDEMKTYTQHIPNESSDYAFFQAVIKIHDNRYGEAQLLIDQARQLIDTDLTTMVNESHDRAYPAMLQVQLMSELEEVIQYRLVPERREMIKQKWWNRMQGCQGLVEDWKKILQVHSLVLSNREDMRSWLKFAQLCDRNHRPDLSFNTIIKLMGVPSKQLFKRRTPLPMHYPEVTLKFIDHLWHASQYKRSFIELNRFVNALETPTFQGATFSYYSSGNNPSTPINEFDLNSMSNDSFSSSTNQQLFNISNKQTPAAINKLLSRAYLKMAECCESLVGFSEQSIPTILERYQKATERDSHWYKAWHCWAFTNFRALKYCKEKQKDLMKNLETPMQTENDSKNVLNPKLFCIQAVSGFFRSITLSQESSLQDTLRILTIWFEDGRNDDVRAALEEGIKSVSIETWLQVIPQLIARIDIPHGPVANLISQLLTDIGKYHPQALIYPLTVASKSSAIPRKTAANNILRLMKIHSPNLVNQAVLVSAELIRIAILWHELWHEGLEEASRLYFGDKNVNGMFETLEPLHQMIERTPLTHTEDTFYQNYGPDLRKAYEHCIHYKSNPKENVKSLNSAWDIYYHVFRRISRQLPTLTSLELTNVSPKLTECIDLELVVPGSYNPKQEIITITKIEPHLNIITSKQRPRKLTIKGSNGRNYMFLLKGHEDLRQDERVMQLFGLVNTLLNKENSTSKQNLAIQRYAVIPLSPNSGLIGWVPHCDTLHALIRDYREKRKILLNMEHRLMLRMAPDYDRLTLMQKVEVFEHALEHTPGDDLAKILWLKSPSSEVWFDRRTNYTRSLAVMSMVGYILGLGDRHPSNLMLDRVSGKILHIDFGDCFEVAMTREKYPEKIPFRLTRMLINAMEVTGLDGTFTLTCQSVMFVMRKHKESLMALLEAFVYDPLLNWRLIEAQPKGKSMAPELIPVGANSSQVGPNGQLPKEPTGTNQIEDGDFITENTSDISSFHRSTVGLKQKLSLNHRQIENKLDYNNEGLNSKAVTVIARVRDKLTGRDFDFAGKPLVMYQQVDRLIKQATSHENLCQCYIGWCPFW